VSRSSHELPQELMSRLSGLTPATSGPYTSRLTMTSVSASRGARSPRTTPVTRTPSSPCVSEPTANPSMFSSAPPRRSTRS
jgi:hypothetical protein